MITWRIETIVRAMSAGLLVVTAMAGGVAASDPTGRVASAVPEGAVPKDLSAADWASIRTAYAAARQAEVESDEFLRGLDPFEQQAYLKASNTSANDWFGHSVALSDDTVVVGTPNEDNAATGVNGNQADNSAIDSGAAYVFVRNGTTWSQQAYLKASNTGSSDYFGTSVAICGDTVLVGAPGEASAATGVDGNQSDNTAAAAGAAYVFVRSGSTWEQQAYLKASNTSTGDVFGWSVAISSDTVVVGAYQEGSAATGVNGNQADNTAFSAGAAYVFVRSGATWSQQAYLKASNTGIADRFAYSVAVSGETVAVGAPFEDSAATDVNGNQADDGAEDAGAAYVFVRKGPTWSQQAYVKAANSGSDDRFGFPVAVSGDTVVVGAVGEDSAATGVNGNQADNATSGSGAAYVFVRGANGWSPQAYMKASNTDAGDGFGYAVAISGDKVVVGALSEDGAATGLNGNQADNSAPSAGAAYTFVRSGTTWSQQAYLKASNTGAVDGFGCSVAASGDALLVGAVAEDSAATGVNGNQTDNSAPQAGAAYVFAAPTPLFPGDMNCDGFVTVGDVGGFVLALTDPAGYTTANPGCDILNADINNDGFVTVGDIGGFAALLTGA